MMEVGSYKWHRRAFTALNQLAGDEQAQVLERLASLVDTPAASWPETLAKRLPDDPSLYLVRINDSLRVILRSVEGQQPEVMDIVRHETLKSFATGAARTGDCRQNIQ
jgi:hypothetical protein